MAREERDDPAAWLLTSEVAAAIGACRVARMAVGSRSGPLLTAQLFSIAAGTVWMVTPRDSVKARVLRRDPRAGVLLRAGRRAVVLQGRVDILDPLRPSGIGRLALAGGAWSSPWRATGCATRTCSPGTRPTCCSLRGSSTAVVDLTGAPPRSPGCIALDRSPAGRPTRFRGLVLRGAGHLHNIPGADTATCSIATDRATWWTGFETRTAPVLS